MSHLETGSWAWVPDVDAAASPTRQPAAAAVPRSRLLPIWAVGRCDHLGGSESVLEDVVYGSLEGPLGQAVRFNVLTVVAIVLELALVGNEAAQLCVDEIRTAAVKFAIER